MWGRILGIVAVLIAAAPAAAFDELNGAWRRGDGKARVRIAPCGASLCAVNTWVTDKSGGENVGDRLVMTLTRQGENSFKGSAYDPQRNMNFSMDIKTTSNGFTSSGCVLGGIVCRTMSWMR